MIGIGPESWATEFFDWFVAGQDVLPVAFSELTEAELLYGTVFCLTAIVH